MNNPTLLCQWLEEEQQAHIHGWDFSHLKGRYQVSPLPWEYRALVDRYRQPSHKLLDLDTGGGEFLLSLGHPSPNTAATENYPPNVALCRQTLLPLGVDFRQADAGGALPFADASFDLVINRHGRFDARELFRVLRPGGVFVTQQVGARNDRELVDLLLPGLPLPFPGQTLQNVRRAFRRAGFLILDGQEAFLPIRFYDVGALVWFARVIEWEFPGFEVRRCLPGLEKAQRILEDRGCVEGTMHRFWLAAQKTKECEHP